MQINTVSLIGRAGRDAEITFFESGARKATVGMAVDKGKDTPPSWFEIEFWGKTAEIAGNWIKKGGLFAVEGELSIDTWSDRNTGEPRSKPVIKANSMKLLGGRSDNNNSQHDEF